MNESMTKEEAPIKVHFNLMNFWWLRNGDGGGALAPLEHCDQHGNVVTFGTSYAHVYPDGEIKRYGTVIGHRDDLKFAV